MKNYEKPKMDVVKFQSSGDIADGVTISSTLASSALKTFSTNVILDY
ncbi:MAG: hypothetical protein LUG24_07305 [Clostridiales bacterium]|nr:hypothetical protein [Clostridiales bacterium]